MAGHMTVHDVIWDVRIDDYEELEEVRQGLIRSLQDIERLLDGAQVGAINLTVPDSLQVM
jgi:hypothetical protein